MNKGDRRSLIVTFGTCIMAGFILCVVFFGPGFDSKLQENFVKSAYPNCPVVQTHAGVFIVRKQDNSVVQVRVGGIFYLHISEAKELIPQNTIF